MLIIERFFC